MLAVQECEGYDGCTRTDVQLVEDVYQAEVNKNPGVMLWLCPVCHDRLTWEI